RIRSGVFMARSLSFRGGLSNGHTHERAATFAGDWRSDRGDNATARLNATWGDFDEESHPRIGPLRLRVEGSDPHRRPARLGLDAERRPAVSVRPVHRAGWFDQRGREAGAGAARFGG